LGERLTGSQEVIGSIPLGSTLLRFTSFNYGVQATLKVLVSNY